MIRFKIGRKGKSDETRGEMVGGVGWCLVVFFFFWLCCVFVQHVGSLVLHTGFL